MNIAMISEHASPLATLGGADAGGQNVHVTELSEALARDGHRVRVFTRRDDRHTPQSVLLQSGVIIEQVDAGPPRAISKDRIWPFIDDFGRGTLARLRAERADVIHAHFWMSGCAALAVRHSLAIPVVQTFHALGSEKRRMQGAGDTSPFERIREEERIIRETDRIIATASSEIFELLRLGADPRRLKIVPCGVDMMVFDACLPCGFAQRRFSHRIVTLSRLVERKGVSDVIAALARIPDTELLIAGGPDASSLATDDDVRRLLREAKACGVAERVTFLGRVNRREVASLLKSADVIVCAPWYEPFGIVPLEAMAAGRPVVATAVGGQIDTVCDGFTGLHVPARQPEAIARAVNELLADTSRRQRLGAAGRERARRYSWERVARETYAVYSSLVTTASDDAAVNA